LFTVHCLLLTEKLLDDEGYNPNKEHDHGDFVNPVHHAQIEVGFAIRIVFSEEVAEYRS